MKRAGASADPNFKAVFLSWKKLEEGTIAIPSTEPVQGTTVHLGLFRAQVFPAVARAGGDRPLERAGLVASQLLGLALTRYLLKLPPLVAMERETIVREIGATVQRYAAGGL